MENVILEKILMTGRLILRRRRLFRHYAGVLLLLFLSIFLITFIAVKSVDSNFAFKTPMLIFLIFPLFTITAFINQYVALNLKTFETVLSKADNYSIAKDAIKTLKWKIRIDNIGFIEAFNDYTSFGRTTGEDMISIIITDNKILINSIGNVDGVSDWQVSFSFGKHTENINKFLAAFEILSQFKVIK